MYQFYFGRMELPITPQKLAVKIKGNNKTLSLVNESEINFLKNPGLTEITFDAVLPMLGKYSFSGDYHRPDYYLDAFENLMLSRKPFRFIVSRVSPSGKLLYDTNMNVSLESYTVTEDATQGFDVTVSITLKQYIAYATKKVTVSTAGAGGSKPVVTEEKKRDDSSAPRAKTYTVKSGDCLWSIAKRCLGNGARYTEIYQLNKYKIKNPNLIYAGQVLTLP